MVRRLREQKIKGRNFDARRDGRSAQGAAVKRKGDGKRRSRERRQQKTALDGSHLDTVRKVTRAVPGQMKIRKESEREDIQHDLLLETQTDLPTEAAKVPKAMGQRYQPIREKRPASWLQVHAGKVHGFLL